MGEQGTRREEVIFETTQRKVHNPMAKIQGKTNTLTILKLFLESTRIFVWSQSLVCNNADFNGLSTFNWYVMLEMGRW